MAYIEKKNLKLVIDDLSMLLVQKTPIVVASGETPAITIAPDYELPVTVDTLQTTGGEPTINHYKVIGQDGDWTSSSTPGEWTVQFTVPTLHTDVLKFAFGESNVKILGTITAADFAEAGKHWEGVGVGLESKKITCSLVIMNGAKDKMVIFRNVDLWAHVMKEANGNPYCVQFNGTVVSDGSDDMMILKKVVTQGG